MTSSRTSRAGRMRAFMLAAMSLCTAGSATAQFSSDACTVSVLNRTVRVNPDGSWVLPNIPANFGFVRARVTCSVDGQTISGESEPFLVPANGVVNLPHITFGSTTPIPTSMTLTAFPASLTQTGSSAQLTAIARYTNGSTKDVTASSTGTQYTISNPAIATISSEGIVTAVQSGTVLIQATQEGASGITTVQVVLGGQSNQGIPSSWALQFGLNPTGPTLAAEDQDRDGLTNLQEFELGTNPVDRDTDGDGLRDGDEANVYTTNPLLSDSDADRIPDGIEVQTRTEPLNPASYDLQAATAASVLRPQSFQLSTSPLALIASQQLSWSVTLIDGKTTLDITNDLRTSYSSSDLTICNFSSQKGLIFAGSAGNCVVTISQNTLSVTVPGTIQSFTPTERSSIGINGAVAVDAAGTTAYVAAGVNGLVVVDVTDATAPRLRGRLASLGNAVAIRAIGQRALVADANGLLRIVDASNPDAPTVLASLPIAGRPNAVAVQGSIVAVAAQSGGVSFVDISDLTTPRLISTVGLSGTALGIDFDVQRGIAAVAMGSGGMQLLDISAINAPQLRGLLPGGDVRRVLLRYPAALLADVQRSVTAVNVSNPSQPTVTSSIPPNLGGSPVDIAAFGSVAMTADVSFGRAIPVITLANPLQPSTVLFWTPGSAGFSSSIAVDARFGYLVMPNQLRIFQYQEIIDTAGIPPTIQITSPTSGAQAIHGSNVTVRATAADDVAVAQVSFAVNGQPAVVATAAPYEYILTVPDSGSTLTLGATATDFGNNTGGSTEIVLDLIPDPLTTVTGRVVLQDGIPAVGASLQCASRTGSTIADGTFSITGVPTILPTIRCTAAFTTDTGVSLGGRSNAVQPVRSGTTDVAVIVIAPVPVITSITPKVIESDKPAATIQVTGANLTEAAFSFASSALAVGTPQINAEGTAATLPITISGSPRGRFALIGTNTFGSSNPTPTAGNTLTLINAQDDVDSDGDGFPDGLELMFGSDPALASSLPSLTARGELRSAAVSVVNVALPESTQQEALSAAFSVLNTELSPAPTQMLLSAAVSVLNAFDPSSSHLLVGPAVSVLNTLPATLQTQLVASLPAVDSSLSPTPPAPPLGVSLGGVQNGQVIVEGQTITVAASVTGNEGSAAVTFTVNGMAIATDTIAPLAMTFTAPTAIPALTFGASVSDTAGHAASAASITVAVEADSATVVSGRVVDWSGNPVAGATVELLSQGLSAEFFDYTAPLAGLPDLAGAIPVRATRVTAINAHGPDGLYGRDPFGAALAPDYAARFTGWIAIPTAGAYTFYLGADEGARLRLGSTTIVDMPAPAAGFQESAATVTLNAGLIPVEITFYESVGNAQLQLSFAPQGGERQVVPPSMLVPSSGPFAVVTDVNGRFALPRVPTALQTIWLRASVIENGQTMSTTSNAITVTRETTPVGEIVMPVAVAPQ